jgi:uroporphyrinogen decarboxylase
MNSEERILKTLRHEETDRIPIFEWIVDKRVIDVLYPDMTNDEFINSTNLDAICAELDYGKKEVRPGMFVDEWGTIKQHNSEEYSCPIAGPIKTMRDLNKYIPPDPKSPERFRTLDEKLIKNMDNKAIILRLNDVLSVPLRLMGFQELLMAFWDAPKLVMGLVDLSVSINLELAKEAVKRGVKIVYTGDNYAYNSGPLIAPENFKKFLYPYLCKVVKGFKELGLYVIKHTGGNVMPIVDMIIDSGIDCLDSIDPLAGMNLEFMKQKYGKRIALKGNVDCSKTLSFGTREEVIEETKKCIRIGAPGGGYILSSSNSIHSKVNPENFKAMIETAREFGKYPMNF